jgi:hypothetical protein
VQVGADQEGVEAGARLPGQRLDNAEHVQGSHRGRGVGPDLIRYSLEQEGRGVAGLAVRALDGAEPGVGLLEQLVDGTEVLGGDLDFRDSLAESMRV